MWKYSWQIQSICLWAYNYAVYWIKDENRSKWKLLRDISLTGLHSYLITEFLLQRHMGHFMINVYVPCTMLVILSWVGFWINREATGDRIALGNHLCTTDFSPTGLCGFLSCNAQEMVERACPKEFGACDIICYTWMSSIIKSFCFSFVSVQCYFLRTTSVWVGWVRAIEFLYQTISPLRMFSNL